MTFFDLKAAQWDLNPDRLELHRKLAQAVSARLPLQKNWRCLDFGCGTGLMALLLSDKVGEITCLDASAGMIRELERKLNSPGMPRNINSRCAMLDENTFGKKSFDFLFTTLTLHHIGDVESLIKIFGGIIKNGGCIALIDLDQEDGSFHQNSEVNVPHNGFSRDYLETLLRAAGFENISSKTAAYHVRRKEDGTSRSYPLFLITGRKI
ncbi:MAG: class I SAM-dependent methyltransferase [Victivallaceae bacterium]|nr:class I SAM-dependent methyltransferase [Victivallaceae bacterium]